MTQYTTSFRVPDHFLIKVINVGLAKQVTIGGSMFIAEEIKDDRLHVTGFLAYRTVETQKELVPLQAALTNNDINYYTRVTK